MYSVAAFSGEESDYDAGGIWQCVGQVVGQGVLLIGNSDRMGAILSARNFWRLLPKIFRLNSNLYLTASSGYIFDSGPLQLTTANNLSLYLLVLGGSLSFSFVSLDPAGLARRREIHGWEKLRSFVFIIFNNR